VTIAPQDAVIISPGIHGCSLIAQLHAPDARIAVILVTGKKPLWINTAIALWIPIPCVCYNVRAKYSQNTDGSEVKVREKHREAESEFGLLQVQTNDESYEL
jgi:hypothetical protein